VSPLRPGDDAPTIAGVPTDAGPLGLFFYKVTCPTCQLAAPVMGAFERAFPGAVIGIGQDPERELQRFTETYDLGIASIEDEPPYPTSDAFGIVSVPTLFLVADGSVVDTVGAWERDGFNRVAARLAERFGTDPVLVSTPDDCRPAFKPG
jgi:hypothetical protein